MINGAFINLDDFSLLHLPLPGHIGVEKGVFSVHFLLLCPPGLIGIRHDYTQKGFNVYWHQTRMWLTPSTPILGMALWCERAPPMRPLEVGMGCILWEDLQNLTALVPFLDRKRSLWRSQPSQLKVGVMGLTRIRLP